MVDLSKSGPHEEDQCPFAMSTLTANSVSSESEEGISDESSSEIDPMILKIRASVKLTSARSLYMKDRSPTNFKQWFWALTRKMKLEQGLGELFDDVCKEYLIEKLTLMYQEKNEDVKVKNNQMESEENLVESYHGSISSADSIFGSSQSLDDYDETLV